MKNQNILRRIGSQLVPKNLKCPKDFVFPDIEEMSVIISPHDFSGGILNIIGYKLTCLQVFDLNGINSPSGCVGRKGSQLIISAHGSTSEIILRMSFRKEVRIEHQSYRLNQ